MEAMPFIQKLLQRNTRGPRTEAHPDTFGSVTLPASSFPESAFLETLAALKTLPNFERQISTVNEHGQSLLHLAVHLRYRKVVQRLVGWGIDLNAKDVNGFTALDAAFLCNDSFIVHILEKRDPNALVLDGLGRPLIKKVAMGHNRGMTLVNQGEWADMTFNSLQSPNGPKTFEEACSQLGFSREDTQKLTFVCPLVSSPPQALPQGAGPITQAGCAVSLAFSHQTSGIGECSSMSSSNVVLPASLLPLRSPSTSPAPPRLAARPDPTYISHWTTVANQVSTWSPGHAGPLNNGGESPLMAFVDRRDSTFHCLVPVGGEFCGYLNGKKERILSHIRDKHLDQRPWRCSGECGNTAW